VPETAAIIRSERRIVLQPGKAGTRVELEGVSPSSSPFAVTEGRIVALTWCGDLARFDNVGKGVYKSTAGESLGSSIGDARLIQPESGSAGLSWAVFRLRPNTADGAPRVRLAVFHRRLSTGGSWVPHRIEVADQKGADSKLCRGYLKLTCLTVDVFPSRRAV
jgi:hypothetical protein